MDRLTGLKHDGDNWVLELTPRICNPWGAIYGGAAIAACVHLAQEETGHRARLATTRFLRAPQMEELLTLRLSADAVGRRTSHVSITATVDGEVAFDTVAVVGSGDQRPEAVNGQWVQMPDVPTPEQCQPMPTIPELVTWAHGQVERRLASGSHFMVSAERGDGRAATWVRFTDPEVDSASPEALAWLADCVAIGLGSVIGPLSRGTSLDNTVRYAAPRPSEWVLVESIGTAASAGYGYGEVHLFAEDGTLLATGSQTMLVRVGDLTFRP